MSLNAQSKFELVIFGALATMLFSLVILFLPGGALAQERQNGEFSIGAILPLSGPAAMIGQQHQRGIELAVESFNQSSSAVKLKLLIEDDQADPKQAIGAFRRLHEEQKVQVFFVAMSSTAMNLKPFVEREHVLMFADVSHPYVLKDSSYILRNFFTVDVAVANVVRFAQKRGLKRVALLYSEDELGEASFENMQTQAEAGGLNFVGGVSFQKQAADLKTELFSLASRKPELTYIVGNGPAMARALKQARQINYAGSLVGWAICNQSSVLSAAGIEATNGLYSVDPLVDHKSSQYVALQSAYDNKYSGQKLEIGSIARYGSVTILAQALEAGMRSPEKIRAWIIAKGDFDLPTGMAKFTSEGEVKMPMGVFGIKENLCSPIS